jgi:hypothetical protein
MTKKEKAQLFIAVVSAVGLLAVKYRWNLTADEIMILSTPIALLLGVTVKSTRKRKKAKKG